MKVLQTIPAWLADFDNNFLVMAHLVRHDVGRVGSDKVV
jgi:hypothetical protein